MHAKLMTGHSRDVVRRLQNSVVCVLSFSFSASWLDLTWLDQYLTASNITVKQLQLMSSNNGSCHCFARWQHPAVRRGARFAGPDTLVLFLNQMQHNRLLYGLRWVTFNVHPKWIMQRVWAVSQHRPCRLALWCIKVIQCTLSICFLLYLTDHFTLAVCFRKPVYFLHTHTFLKCSIDQVDLRCKTGRWDFLGCASPKTGSRR